MYNITRARRSSDEGSEGKARSGTTSRPTDSGTRGAGPTRWREPLRGASSGCGRVGCIPPSAATPVASTHTQGARDLRRRIGCTGRNGPQVWARPSEVAATMTPRAPCRHNNDSIPSAACHRGSVWTAWPTGRSTEPRTSSCSANLPTRMPLAPRGRPAGRPLHPQIFDLRKKDSEGKETGRRRSTARPTDSANLSTRSDQGQQRQHGCLRLQHWWLRRQRREYQ
jgi:hypothetical protein